jgi:hypothetical protein
VFYADKYHPIQAGSIDGTDVAPHDNAVLRALICSQAGLCACAFPLSPSPPTPSVPLPYMGFPPVPFQTTLSATPRPPATPTARFSSVASRARPTTTRFGRCAPSAPLTCVNGRHCFLWLCAGLVVILMVGAVDSPFCCLCRR